MVRRQVFLFLAGCVLLVHGVPRVSGQAATPSTTQAGTAGAQASAAQGTPVADPVILKDPNAAMLLAARVNGLASPDMKPWHLKANYQTFDADGKPKDQGVFEEWWAGPEKYKISYADPDFHQVEYRNGGKLWLTGDSRLPSLPEAMVERYLTEPLPTADAILKHQYHTIDKSMGAVSLTCLQPEEQAPNFTLVPRRIVGPPPKTSNTPLLPTACFTPGTSTVRVEIFDGGLFVLFNNMVDIAGHYFAKTIAVENSKLEIVNMSVTALDSIAVVHSSDFIPPASATEAPARISTTGYIPGRLRDEYGIPHSFYSRTEPDQAMVILEGTVTTQGTMNDVRVISGPSELQRAALDFVKSGKFKPVRSDSDQGDARMDIDLIFSLW